jgi:hypothetical protein
MNTRTILVLLFITASLFFLPTYASAVDDCFDSSIRPIPICTCSDLNQTRNNISASYKVQNDIDCSATNTWSSSAGWFAIADTYNGRFTGVFDGGGYNISRCVR